MKKEGIIYSEMSEDSKTYIKNLHKKFYNNIKKNLRKQLFINQTGKMINFKYHK